MLQVAFALARFRGLAGAAALLVWLWLAGDSSLLPVVGIATTAGVVIWLVVHRFGSRESAVRVATTAVAVANFVAAVTVGQAILAAASSEAAMAAELPPRAESDGGPSIYVLLLDGYPRADTLEENFSYDNSSFLEALNARGFEVAEESRANYNQTVLTIASMLDMRHISDNPALDPSGSAADQKRRLARAISGSRVPAFLRERGYSIEMIGSPFVTYGIRTADRWIDTGQLTEAEVNIVVQAAKSGPLGELLRDPLAAQHRNRVLDSLAAVRSVAAADEPGPRFVFAHVMSPHSPFVFYRDGSGRELPSCFPRGCGFWDGWPEQIGYDRSQFSDALGQQVQFLNSLVLETIDAIIREESTPPIILVMSDHGTRYSGDDTEEMMRILFAAYSPGIRVDFPDNISPIVVFPRLLARVFEVNIEEPRPAEYQLPMGVPVGPLEIEPYP